MRFGIVFQPTDKVDPLFCPVGEQTIEIVRLVEDRHAAFRRIQVGQKLLVVHFRLADGRKNGRVGVYVVQHVDFQPAFLLPVILGGVPHTFHDVRKQGHRSGVKGVKLLETHVLFPADRQKRTEIGYQSKVIQPEKLFTPLAQGVTRRTLFAGAQSMFG